MKTAEQFTALLAERVMRWKVCPDRFVKSGRAWIPKWRFQPFVQLEDAFLLLDRTEGSYALTVDPDGISRPKFGLAIEPAKLSVNPKHGR